MMKITLIGPGIMPIPPTGWGAVEILVWDTKNALEFLGHTVQIVNTKDHNQIINEINEFNPDFVHIHYDEFVGLYPYIQYPKAITSHFGYLEKPEMFGGYANVANAFAQIKPNVFCLSDGIRKVYKVLMNIPEEKLFLTPNGVNTKIFKFNDTPKYSDRSIYLAKIDYRKRQHLFQSIDSLWFAGNIADNKFDSSKNYLGEWSKETLYDELTDYGNLVLLSDGEAHPLVCMEALSAGLGVVVSECAQANLDVTKEFITVIPEDKITDIEYVESEILKNREYSVNNRNEIKEYSYQFDWINVIEKYHLPSIENLIDTYHSEKSKPMNVLFDFTEKNKSAYKLKGLPPIYYLNLDDQPERAEYMESQFKYWEIENYTRISAYDGRDGRDLGDILKGRYPDMMSSGEVGCVTSHLKALKHFLETSDAPCALIMEDDCDLDTVKHWEFTWKDFFCKVPYDYDVVQLAIINPAQVHMKMHRRFVNDFSTACYLITRHHVQKLINLHVRGDKYKIDNGVKPRAVADDLIYNSGNTFAIPLFLYKLELGSSIHTEHLDIFHKSSYEGLWNFWKNDSTNIEDWNAIFDYDPYFGRLPPGFEGK